MPRDLYSVALGAERIFYFEDQPSPDVETGARLLILHGFPDTPMRFAAVGESLAAQGYRVFRPYLPGYAPSESSERITIARARDTLLAFVAAMGGDDWLLLGHDWGAVLSYSMLVADPELFTCAVTMSVPHLGHLLPKTAKSLSQVRRSLYVLLFQLPFLPERLLPNRIQLVTRLCKRWSPGFSFSSEIIEEIESCLRASASAPFDYYRDLPRMWLASNTMRKPIETPLLYLHGRDDGCIGAQFAVGQEPFFRSRFEMQLLPCGHFPHIEIPDQLASRLTRWFADAIA